MKQIVLNKDPMEDNEFLIDMITGGDCILCTKKGSPVVIGMLIKKGGRYGVQYGLREFDIRTGENLKETISLLVKDGYDFHIYKKEIYFHIVEEKSEYDNVPLKDIKIGTPIIVKSGNKIIGIVKYSNDALENKIDIVIYNGTQYHFKDLKDMFQNSQFGHTFWVED